jgi:hypothetical protein
MKRLSSQRPGATEEDTHMADPPRSPDTGVGSDRGEGMPRWVKVSGIIVLVLILLVVVMLLIGGGGGGHGPSRHGSGSSGGQAPSSSVTDVHVPPERAVLVL